MAEGAEGYNEDIRGGGITDIEDITNRGDITDREDISPLKNSKIH